VLHYESISYGDQKKSDGCNDNGNGCPKADPKDDVKDGGAGPVAVPGGDGATGAKKALMLRGKAKFSAEWGRALTCTFLHKSVGSQLDAFVPATRLSTLRLLLAVDAASADALLCGADHTANDHMGGAQGGAQGFRRAWGLAAGVGTQAGEVVRLRAIVETLIAAKVRAPRRAPRASVAWERRQPFLLVATPQVATPQRQPMRVCTRIGAHLLLLCRPRSSCCAPHSAAHALVPAQVHVTLVLTGHDAVEAAGAGESAGAGGLEVEVPALAPLPGCSCAPALRYLGVHVVSQPHHRKS